MDRHDAARLAMTHFFQAVLGKTRIPSLRAQRSNPLFFEYQLHVER
jgi:hypothetical protein